MSGADVAVWIGFGTFFATFLGPVLAVEVSRRRDIQRAIYQRKLDVFRVLMRTRRKDLSPEYVNALNLIEVEFHDVDPVITCWRRFLDMVSSPAPRTANDNVMEIQRRRRIIDEMLTHMAKNLDMKIDKIPVAEGGYNPQGHVDLEIEQANIRQFFNEVALGKKSIPIFVNQEGAEAAARTLISKPEETP